MPRSLADDSGRPRRVRTVFPILPRPEDESGTPVEVSEIRIARPYRGQAGVSTPVIPSGDSGPRSPRVAFRPDTHVAARGASESPSRPKCSGTFGERTFLRLLPHGSPSRRTTESMRPDPDDARSGETMPDPSGGITRTRAVRGAAPRETGLSVDPFLGVRSPSRSAPAPTGWLASSPHQSPSTTAGLHRRRVQPTRDGA
jgi:hypothetical protein